MAGITGTRVLADNLNGNPNIYVEPVSGTASLDNSFARLTAEISAGSDVTIPVTSTEVFDGHNGAMVGGNDFLRIGSDLIFYRASATNTANGTLRANASSSANQVNATHAAGAAVIPINVVNMNATDDVLLARGTQAEPEDGNLTYVVGGLYFRGGTVNLDGTQIHITATTDSQHQWNTTTALTPNISMNNCKIVVTGEGEAGQTIRLSTFGSAPRGDVRVQMRNTELVVPEGDGTLLFGGPYWDIVFNNTENALGGLILGRNTNPYLAAGASLYDVKFAEGNRQSATVPLLGEGPRSINYLGTRSRETSPGVFTGWGTGGAYHAYWNCDFRGATGWFSIDSRSQVWVVNGQWNDFGQQGAVNPGESFVFLARDLGNTILDRGITTGFLFNPRVVTAAGPVADNLNDVTFRLRRTVDVDNGAQTTSDAVQFYRKPDATVIDFDYNALSGDFQTASDDDSPLPLQTDVTQGADTFPQDGLIIINNSQRYSGFVSGGNDNQPPLRNDGTRSASITTPVNNVARLNTGVTAETIFAEPLNYWQRPVASNYEMDLHSYRYLAPTTLTLSEDEMQAGNSATSTDVSVTKDPLTENTDVNLATVRDTEATNLLVAYRQSKANHALGNPLPLTFSGSELSCDIFTLSDTATPFNTEGTAVIRTQSTDDFFSAFFTDGDFPSITSVNTTQLIDLGNKRISAIDMTTQNFRNFALFTSQPDVADRQNTFSASGTLSGSVNFTATDVPAGETRYLVLRSTGGHSLNISIDDDAGTLEVVGPIRGNFASASGGISLDADDVAAGRLRFEPAPTTLPVRLTVPVTQLNNVGAAWAVYVGPNDNSPEIHSGSTSYTAGTDLVFTNTLTDEMDGRIFVNGLAAGTELIVAYSSGSLGWQAQAWAETVMGNSEEIEEQGFHNFNLTPRYESDSQASLTGKALTCNATLAGGLIEFEWDGNSYSASQDANEAQSGRLVASVMGTDEYVRAVRRQQLLLRDGWTDPMDGSTNPYALLTTGIALAYNPIRPRRDGFDVHVGTYQMQSLNGVTQTISGGQETNAVPDFNTNGLTTADLHRLNTRVEAVGTDGGDPDVVNGRRQISSAEATATAVGTEVGNRGITLQNQRNIATFAGVFIDDDNNRFFGPDLTDQSGS